MHSSKSKRLEQAIQSLRDRADWSPQAAEALEDLCDAIREIDGRLSTLEGRQRLRPTAEMDLPNRNRRQN